MQNHITRLISFTKIKDKVNLKRFYFSFNILKLEDIFKLEIGKFMYLQYNNLLPEVFADYFTLVSTGTCRQGRQLRQCLTWKN